MAGRNGEWCSLTLHQGKTWRCTYGREEGFVTMTESCIAPPQKDRSHPEGAIGCSISMKVGRPTSTKVHDNGEEASR